MSTNKTREAIHRAGGCSAVARLFGVSRQAVLKWTYTQVPAERARKLAKAAQLPPEMLRPDVFED